MCHIPVLLRVVEPSTRPTPSTWKLVRVTSRVTGVCPDPAGSTRLYAASQLSPLDQTLEAPQLELARACQVFDDDCQLFRSAVMFAKSVSNELPEPHTLEAPQAELAREFHVLESDSNDAPEFHTLELPQLELARPVHNWT